MSILPDGAIARQPFGVVTAVDCHAHVFKRGLPLADVRRYAPDYYATPEDYIKVLDANGVSHAVLVQPSFLGTDNHYLLDVLRRYPRFRGIARGSADKAAVVGIRLDLSSATHPQLDIEPWPALLKLQVEVQAEARRWPVLLPPLSKAGVQCDRPFRQA